ncbi:SOS response-associated peptidase family protein [Pseudomonas canadensis]|uniref:SOS response-associated peptidase family protein n=1 Tax=Pseudomonas canadensis TaxID=915099 RepID=UPI0030CD94E6
MLESSAYSVEIGGKSTVSRATSGDNMCGILSQYRGIHEFAAALTMPNALANPVGDQPFERYNVSLTTKLRYQLQGELLHAAGSVAMEAPLGKKSRDPDQRRVENVAHNPFFRAIWSQQAITPIDSWFECEDEDGLKKQPYLIRRREPDEAAAEHHGFVIITADSAGGMVDIHDRRRCNRSGTWSANGWTRRQPWCAPTDGDARR